MSPFVEKIIKNRGVMWLIFALYFAIFLAVDAASKIAGDVVLAIGVAGVGAVFLWSRPRSGRGSISTRCQNCDSSLQGVGGWPRSSCGQCGHRQSWGRQK